jgi:hypothetical protein
MKDPITATKMRWLWIKAPRGYANTRFQKNGGHLVRTKFNYFLTL